MFDMLDKSNDFDYPQGWRTSGSNRTDPNPKAGPFGFVAEYCYTMKQNWEMAFAVTVPVTVRWLAWSRAAKHAAFQQIARRFSIFKPGFDSR